jgi:MFS family permease
MIERPLLARARFGILAGLGYAVVYSLVAVAVFRFKDPADLAKIHASLSQVVFAYVAGAVVGGAVVGALLPIARWAPGAFLVGTIGTLPFFLMASLLIASDAPWFPDQLVMALIASMLLGGLLGLFFQSQPKQ